MKKCIILTIFLMAIINSSFSQETKSSKKPLTREEYLVKSKNQKVGAWILLGIGVVSLTVASTQNLSFDAAGVLVFVGGICTLSSIPLFLASGRNKRRSKTALAYLNLQKISNYQFAWKRTGCFPALSVKLNL